MSHQDSDKYMTLGYLKSFYLDQVESGLEDLNKSIKLNPENSLAYLLEEKQIIFYRVNTMKILIFKK